MPETASLNGGSGKSTAPQTTQNRCYPTDSGAGNLAAAPEGSCVYVALPADQAAAVSAGRLPDHLLYGTLCRLKPDYKGLCASDATYIVYGANCYACCDRAGLDECFGHPVCEEHVQRLRHDAIKQHTWDGPPFLLRRVRTLAVAS